MKKLFSSLVGFSFLIAVASSFAASEETKMSGPMGDAEKGKKKAGTCTACHGRQGNSAIPSNPKLAGQNAKYIAKQIKDFQTGARKDPLMSSQARGISEQDALDIGAYYAAQETTFGKAKKEYAELGEKLYRGGNPKSGLPACIACHGPAGKGVSGAGFPALRGQHASYTEKQLKAFRAAGRGDHKGAKRMNDGEGSAAMMQALSAKLTDDEIVALSSYIEGLR